MVMKQGDMVEMGTTEKVFENPETEYTRTLIAAALDLKATGLDDA